MIQRAVNVKTKASLRSNIMVQNSNIYCPKSYCFFNNTTAKVQIQRTAIKDSGPKKPKTKDLKFALLHTNIAELLE